MPIAHEVLHRFETIGLRRLYKVAAVVTLGALILFYDWRSFHNFSNPEAMDAAQLARNVAEGKGYVTSCIRPLSMGLLKHWNEARPGPSAAGTAEDPYRLKSPHPDLANPPVYPILLAGWMKLLPFHYDISTLHGPFWRSAGVFWRYQPDFLIGLFNQLLFLALGVALFFFARRYFDRTAAWLSTLLLLSTDLLWRFSLSGLPTMLAMLLFMGLAWCLALFEEETRTPRFGKAGLWLLAAAAGLLTGIGALTLYSFAWLAIPAALFVAAVTPNRRVLLGSITLAAFAAVLLPWVARNVALCGAPFGTGPYALVASTEFQPERSLEFAGHLPWLSATRLRLLVGSSHLLQSDLPRLGGTWLSAFFLVGLLVRFRNSTVNRVRFFLVAALLLLFAAQALGRPQLTEEAPEVTSWNLLVLLTPLVILYGVSLVLTLLEGIIPSEAPARPLALGAVGAVGSLPFLLGFLSPAPGPMAWPPYSPEAIQTGTSWLKPGEMMMSDIPWAVAWYGERDCLWLTPNILDGFLPINDYQKPISAVYFSPVSLDRKFASETIGVYVDKEKDTETVRVRVRGAEKGGWSDLIYQTYALNLKVPTDFPLRQIIPVGRPYQHLFLTDYRHKAPPEK